jgi:3',5'-cyclic AMP phosphodiesterase CpdA
MKKLSRREFFSLSTKAGFAAFTASAVSPFIGRVSVAEAKSHSKVSPFNFVVVGDTHLYEMPNHRFDKTFQRAINDILNMKPKPDFVLFIGDLAQFGKVKELEKGKRFLDTLEKAGIPVKIIPGEHDWYLDMGKKWKQMFGRDFWSFDHKGVHFIGMNSILVEDYWTAKNMTPWERMLAIAELECHVCGLWGVGERQLEWLEKDVKNLRPDTPVVIFTHSPLWDYYPRWNFQTKDAPQIREILSKFEKVIAIHGHVHQVVYNRTGNMVHIGNLATAWPWPYPPVELPYPKIRMNRVDPGDIYDGLGFAKTYIDDTFVGKLNYKTWAELLPEEVKRGILL